MRLRLRSKDLLSRLPGRVLGDLMLGKTRDRDLQLSSAVHESGEGPDRFREESDEIGNLPESPSPHSLDVNSSAVAGIPPELRRVLSLADPAVLLLDEAGFFLFANSAANSLLDYGDGEILGVHFTQVCIHDLSWLEGEFQRLKSNQIWSGHVVLRSRQGRLVNVGVNAGALTRTAEPVPGYIALIHPVAAPVEARAAELEDLPHGLTAADIRTLQLLIDGFETADIAVIQGDEESTVTRNIEAILLKAKVSSVVGACLVALKSNLLT
jgi:PAS domain S-box-containing protein